MRKQALNAREYDLPDTFLPDLVVELTGIGALRPPPTIMPSSCEREYPVDLNITKPIRACGMRTAPDDKVTTTWCYQRPDGSVCCMEAVVNPDLVKKLEGASMSGKERTDALYLDALPAVMEAFNADWARV